MPCRSCAGYVHDALDVAGFAASLEDLVARRADPSLREAARQAALPWSLEAAGQAMVALYRSLLAESRAS